MKKITVLTPTYNRGSLLKHLYQSLCIQEFVDFEWIIVSDGSEDRTEEIVDEFKKEKRLDIRFIKKENGGKPSAHNAGVLAADSELTVICDDDDYMAPMALKMIAERWEADDCVGGMIGYMGESETKILGGRLFPKGLNQVSRLSDIFKEGIFDTVQIYKTEILKGNLFPIEPTEKFVPEIWCWTEIDKYYKLIVIPEILEIAKYLPGGLTRSGSQNMWNNPIGYSHYFRQRSELHKGGWRQMKYFGIYQGLRWAKRYPVECGGKILKFFSSPISIYVMCRMAFLRVFKKRM